MGERRAREVRAGYVDHGDGVSSRLNIGYIQLFELFDVAEDVAELGPESCLFFRGQVEPGEMSDVLNVEFCVADINN